ncbi:MAG: purine-nucleoside phosphorylase, partial [Sphingobacteriales bacterium]
MNMYDKIQEAARFLQQHNGAGATIGIVLGSGLGNFTNEIEVTTAVPYADIPHFPVSTVKGHS